MPTAQRRETERDGEDVNLNLRKAFLLRSFRHSQRLEKWKFSKFCFSKQEKTVRGFQIILFTSKDQIG